MHIKGANPIIEKLPDGYRLFELPRLNTPRVDSYLFGHPSGKPYNSSVTFFPHFLAIVEGTLDSCQCKLLARESLRCQDHIPASEPPAMATSSSSAPKGKQKGGLAEASKMVGSGLGDASEDNDNDYYDDENDLTDEESGDLPELPPSAGHDVATESDNMDDLA
ncbi:uncharacterized protein N7515_008669 [Penicillium bovifimosum]|uniref:Cryptic loci regulator 2 N-terminal domain-containing protein n=1 Tax=Penicillium bovifimosum TaxID=126998 RepID=A0A9W9GNV5_9EURO|nr:uncharacterized protein N7515_008669 [Penicillium bovifimosum]KAJ5124844.1 hypothetical protein N7515_008669 [Penicillium bovifimosum]